MIVTHEVMPTDPKRIAAMQEPGPAGPIVMLNLLKVRGLAGQLDIETTFSTGFGSPGGTPPERA